MSLSCQEKSDCFGGRLVEAEVQKVAKLVVGTDSILVDRKGWKYVPCNLPTQMMDKQDYIVDMKLLNIKPDEKWAGKPCEIQSIIIKPGVQFDLLKTDQRTVFTGRDNDTPKGDVVVVGVYVTKLSDTEISYTLTELIDWKHPREIEGKAKLDPGTQWQIELKKDKIEAAYKFIDKEKDISILISKTLQVNQSHAIVYEEQVPIIRGVLYNK
ncbi:MAG: hypothetical protein AB8F95_00360 [Bacteroidia bacterium]